MAELVFKEEVFTIVGAAMEVHTVLGPGFLEPVYQEALEIESRMRKLPFEPQKVLQIRYEEHILKKEYIADLIYFNQIVGGLKALDRLSGKEEAQLLNYLKATGMKVRGLINFGSHPKLECKRLVF